MPADYGDDAKRIRPRYVEKEEQGEECGEQDGDGGRGFVIFYTPATCR